jgi:hypothetical protein
MPSTRINLHVHALNGDSAAVVHVLHIGFFPTRIASQVAAHLNARGIAFNSDVPRQSGMVDVVTCVMRLGGTLDPHGPEVVTASLDYEPPRARGEAGEG